MRKGQSLLSLSRKFGVPLSTIQYWVARAGKARLDRVDWDDQPTRNRPPINRCTEDVEELILRTRKELREVSDLGEFGAAAIQRHLQSQAATTTQAVPSIRTIGRILARNGVLDARHRIRRPPPPRGWFIHELSQQRCELDSFDFIEDLKLKDSHFVQVLTGISLHGGLCVAFPTESISAKFVVECLLEHWREVGLPKYVKFDNGTEFQGSHAHPMSIGRVIRTCLSLGVTPIFAPPRESGFQAEIEHFNGLWQAKVWQRFRFQNLDEVKLQSVRFITAKRTRQACRIEAAPPRRAFPKDWKLNLQEPLKGQLIYLRRTNGEGEVNALGKTYLGDSNWVNRLVKVTIDLTGKRLRIYRLRRRDPNDQKLLNSHRFETPQKPFNE